MGRPSALRLSGVSKTFAGQRALDGVDLEVDAGEIHGLIGQNGSGKSTLVKLLAGYHEPDPGPWHAEIDGRPLALGSSAAAHAAGLRFVHQDLGLVDAMTVTENFHLRPGGAMLGRLAPASDARAATRAIADLGYDLDPHAMVGSLAQSERTAVALARALGDETIPLLVLDEPTASLPGPEVERLFDAVRRVAARGTAILFISHYLDEVLRLAQRVTVLRAARRVTTVMTGEMSHDRLVELLLGRELMHEVPATAHARPAPDRCRLEVGAIAGGTVERLDVRVAAGEIVGVAGLTGSGREMVASLLSGRLPPTAGTVHLDGRPLALGQPRAAIAAGLAYLPANRDADALFADASARENLTIADLGPFRRRGIFRHDRERSETSTWMDLLQVTPPETERPVSLFSGGNRQKIVIGRWMRVRPKVLVIDEPTQGVDVGAKVAIHRLIAESAASGAAVVICSTDSDELTRLAHRVLVMRHGRIAASLTADALSAERIEQEQLRADAPASPLPRPRRT